MSWTADATALPGPVLGSRCATYAQMEQLWIQAVALLGLGPGPRCALNGVLLVCLWQDIYNERVRQAWEAEHPVLRKLGKAA